MKTITTVAARENFAELINQASYGGRRVVLTRRGKPVAALISLNDLRFLEDAVLVEKQPVNEST